MSRRKLRHFAEMDEMAHVFQYPEHMAGKWSSYFNNDHPIVLEIGCGTGRYTVDQAKQYPDRNFIGVDIKGARMWHGATEVRDLQLKNAAFLRCQIEGIEKYFTSGEVAEIWITFPDPQPRESRERKRLPSPRFLELFGRFIQNNGVVHLKTDNRVLFDYAVDAWKAYGMQIEQESRDLYQEGGPANAIGIQTVYESRYLAQGIPICYMRAIYVHDKITPEAYTNKEKMFV